MTVAEFYQRCAFEGRAILRQTRWQEPLFWVIRARVAGGWEYCLIGDDGTQKHLIPTIDITVVEARLPRCWHELAENPVEPLVKH